MINAAENHLLFVEPTGAPTAPIVDDLTKRIAAALRDTAPGTRWRGVHQCTGDGCKAVSDNADHHIGLDGRSGQGWLTNSLAVHYVACHRAEIDPLDLKNAAGIARSFAPVEPTQHELTGCTPSREPSALRGLS